MTTEETLSLAANNILAKSGEDAQFSPNLEDAPETVRILRELDRHTDGDSGMPDREFQPNGFNDRLLFISMREDRFDGDFIKGQEVMLDSFIYTVVRVEIDGPLLELELLKRDA